ncbi:hypothetical protein [Pyxidicoccus sp. MSG2]|uniref:hypothetical protein n=1 Tax=Pyxidicoccus sp. MSG2 TaxID=2996790 RepID=UPI0022717B91|nr:hypothetical protein [Pyxidicoccus sp. MSG2]MCY1024049.1 hypothetical protein [Pyxidicoccus sp. MSG2]
MPPTPPVSAYYQAERVRTVLLLARADIALVKLAGTDGVLPVTPIYEEWRLELLSRLRHLGEELIHAAGLAGMNGEGHLRPAVLSPLVRKVGRVTRAFAGMGSSAAYAPLAELAYEAIADVSVGTFLAFNRLGAIGTHGTLVAVLTAAVEAALSLRHFLRAETRRVASRAAAQSRTCLFA